MGALGFDIVFDTAFVNEPYCGNGVCDTTEDGLICPLDCGGQALREYCYVSYGEALVFERFGANGDINDQTLSYNRLRFCSLLPPMVLDTNHMKIYEDTIIANTIGDGRTYTVPTDLVVGVYYIAAMPVGYTKICQLGETFVAKEGICLEPGIITPCFSGVLQTDGSCVVQAPINLVCPGQLEKLSNGTQICNVYVPIRETYTCERYDGTTYEVDNPVDCLTNLQERYYCDGVEISSPSECSTDLTTEYYCDGVEVKSPNDCVEYLDIKYYCDGKDVSKPQDCKTTVEHKYYCNLPNGEQWEVNGPNDCNQNIDLDVTYTCAGVEVADPSECVQSYEIIYYCDGVEVKSPSECDVNLDWNYYCEGVEIIDPKECKQDVTTYYYCNGAIVDKPEDCKADVERKIYCDGELVDNVEDCKSYFHMEYACEYTDPDTGEKTSWVVEKPEECKKNLKPKLMCGDQEIDDIDDCVQEIIPKKKIKCDEGDYNSETGMCVVKPPIFKDDTTKVIVASAGGIIILSLLGYLYMRGKR